MKKKVEEEWNYERIWEEECEGRCAILHLERCPLYESGECKFPDTERAKKIVEGGKQNMRADKTERIGHLTAMLIEGDISPNQRIELERLLAKDQGRVEQ